MWEQISGDPFVTIIDKNKSTAYFDAPSNITSDTKLVFLLTVYDDDGLKDSDPVIVTIVNEERNDFTVFNQKGLSSYNMGKYEDAIKLF